MIIVEDTDQSPDCVVVPSLVVDDEDEESLLPLENVGSVPFPESPGVPRSMFDFGEGTSAEEPLAGDKATNRFFVDRSASFAVSSLLKPT